MLAWEWERGDDGVEEFTKWGGRRRDINSPAARVNIQSRRNRKWVRRSVFGELLRCCCVVSPSHTYHHSSDTILDLLLAVNKPKKLYFPFLSIIKGSIIILIISTISKLLLYSAADSLAGYLQRQDQNDGEVWEEKSGEAVHSAHLPVHCILFYNTVWQVCVSLRAHQRLHRDWWQPQGELL